MAKNIRLTIGEFSKFCQVTVKALKHYEKLGLLVPNEVDEWSHYRYYDVSQMRQLNGILRLKSMGFSLEEIRDLFDEGTHKPSIPQIEDKIQKVENDINILQRCEIRACCFSKGIQTCAQCNTDVSECRLHNNWKSKMFSIIFNSNRAACIRYIRHNGMEAYAERMSLHEQMTMPL